MRSGRGKLYVGTSGWSYQHWAKGVFYPRGLEQSGWLEYYARQFDTVEVNMTFYRLPRTALLSRWAEATPSRFKFSLKLPRRITHTLRLVDTEDSLRRFVAASAALDTQRGPMLVQLPPTLTCDCGLLDAFLRTVKRVRGRKRWRTAVEFRHPSWRCDDAYAVLDDHGVAAVLADMPACPIPRPNDAPFVYVRRHGPEGTYEHAYSRRQLRADAKRIRGWLDEGRDAYVYYNNDAEGHAVDNAQALREMLERK